MCIVFLLLPSNRYQTGVRIRHPTAGLLTYIVLQQGNQGINADTRIQTLSSQEMQAWQQEATRIDRLTQQNDPSDSFFSTNPTDAGMLGSSEPSEWGDSPPARGVDGQPVGGEGGGDMVGTGAGEGGACIGCARLPVGVEEYLATGWSQR
jgi:hypothetical protein